MGIFTLICFLLISLLFTMLIPTCVTLHFGCKLRLPPRQFPGYTIRTKKKAFHSQRPYHHIALLVFSNPNLQIATFSSIPLSLRNPPSALPEDDKCPANQHTHKENIPFIFTKINDYRSTP